MPRISVFIFRLLVRLHVYLLLPIENLHELTSRLGSSLSKIPSQRERTIFMLLFIINYNNIYYFFFLSLKHFVVGDF